MSSSKEKEQNLNDECGSAAPGWSEYPLTYTDNTNICPTTPDSSYISIAAVSYDSGNFSSHSNVSANSSPFLGVELHNQNVYQPSQEQCDKEKTLFMALQDVRTLRSQLERLSKSEQWYKKELRAQKCTRLDAMERLYAQERKYMQENQRLQRECMRLYEKCANIEKEFEASKVKAVKLCEEQQRRTTDLAFCQDVSVFEIEQQKAIIDDQQVLIEVLRKQKQALITDLKRLAEERDEKILELQVTLAGCEVDNNRMVSKCKELMHQRRDLQRTIDEKETKFLSENAEKLKVENLLSDLRAELQIKEDLLKHKEEQILELQNEFKKNLTKEANVDEVHRLSMTYHKEINDKTRELAQLKCTLIQLREELDSFGELKTKNEQQERQIEHINFMLDARQLELEQLQKTNVEKTEQINELHVILEQHRGEKNVALEELLTTQTSLKALERELIVLNEQYANLCALHERTKFELELRMIEQGKLNFRTEQDKIEVEQLRSRLSTYLKQTSELSARIVELEAKLDMKEQEKVDLETRNNVGLENSNQNKNIEVIEFDEELLLSDEVDNIPKEKDEINFTKISEVDCDDELKNTEENVSKLNIIENFNALEVNNNKQVHVELQEVTPVDNKLDTFQSGLSEEGALKNKTDIKVRAVMNKENVLNNLLSTNNSKVEDVNYFAAVSQTPQTVQRLDKTKQRNSENSSLVAENVRECTTLCQEITREEIDSSNQNSAMNAKMKLFETLKEIIRIHNEQKAPPQFQDIVSLSAIMQENEELKQSLAKVTENEEILKLQAQLEDKALAKENLELKLQKQYDDMESLRKAFLKKDAELYKCEKVAKCNEEHKNLLVTHNEKHYEELKGKCDSLQNIVNNLEASKLATAQELSASKTQAASVAAQFEEAKKDLDKQNEIIAAQQVEIENLTKAEHITQPIIEQFDKDIQTDTTDLDSCIANKSLLAEVETPTNTNKKDVATYIRGVIPVFLDAEQHAQLTNSKKQLRILSQPEEEHDMLLNSANKFYNEENSKSAEIKILKSDIVELEEQLLSKTVVDVENNKKRIDMLTECLQCKNEKIQQINDSKADWEELLLALKQAHELEESNRSELEIKRAELEELNQIFAEQNIEIQDLLRLLQVTDQQYHTEQLKEKSKYAQSLAVLEETLKEKITENEKLEFLIAELNLDNEKLQNDVNEINYKLVSEHDEALALLQIKIEAITVERDEYQKKIQELKDQLSSQQVTKRNAIFFPTITTDLDLNEENTTPSCSDSETTISSKSSDDHLRILTKVLESEYKRKIQRYDLHTNTLLKNIKSLKKALRATKQKATLLREQQKKTEEDLSDLQTTKRLLEEMRLKYEQSQLKIKTLEESLENERKKFEASDFGKSAREDPVHEVPNLIDDYKKLIQQSALTTGRPKTSAVLDLIKRSNQCVPNLSKLETNIYELRDEFKEYIMNYTQHGGKSHNFTIQKETPSLMEELLAAADNY
ncbi:interaptin-like [Teleopsis dalmanni]|uniref:interaptin-like n=1 Tax=Teleopsis dalmanni TaxID=139649 RepID=UPI0018CCFFE7|nr:interaptin-like [Teleopsis dalmanni]